MNLEFNDNQLSQFGIMNEYDLRRYLITSMEWLQSHNKNYTKTQYSTIDTLNDIIKCSQVKPLYESYKSATGWHIRTRDTRYKEREAWLYVSKVHRNGTYSFMMDYAYAKDFSEKTAKKHLAILNENQIKPISLQD